MRFDIEQTALRDMRHHIDLATHFVADLDSITFRNDVRTVYIVTLPLNHLGGLTAPQHFRKHVWIAFYIDL
jgi:hypothetical protein